MAGKVSHRRHYELAAKRTEEARIRASELVKRFLPSDPIQDAHDSDFALHCKTEQQIRELMEAAVSRRFAERKTGT